MPKLWRYTFLFLIAAALLVFLGLLPLADERLHLIFCDVGQGDAILVYRGSAQILVDGGPDSKVLSCLSRHMPFWDKKLELVVLTHADADHYGGLVDVVRRYQIISFAGSIVGKDPSTSSGQGIKVLKDEMEKSGVNGVVVNGDMKMRVGEVELGVIWPTKEYLARFTNQDSRITKVLGAATSEKVNEFSIVLHLKHGEFDALLTGDIEPPATDLVADRLALRQAQGKIEVLKVPHHGSKNGLTEALLEATQPKLAVISVGKNNRYGHPHQEILKLLAAYTQSSSAYMVKRTDMDGEVHITTNGQTWRVH